MALSIHSADVKAAQKKVSDADIARAAVNRDADIANLADYSTKLAELAVGSVERAAKAAEMVQKSSSAIVTIYTGALALVYSADNQPLPARGIVPAVLLGMAVVLSTAYVAFLTPTHETVAGPTPADGLEAKTYERLAALTRISSAMVARRSWTLRASVLSLGVGLASMALPFLALGRSDDVDSPSYVVGWLILGASLVAVGTLFSGERGSAPASR